jgi:hypothetical protein
MSNRETRRAAERRNLQNRRLRSQRARLVDRKLGSNRKKALRNPNALAENVGRTLIANGQVTP